jgi:uncharacterized protein YndB with AHSA1/START domain
MHTVERTRETRHSVEDVWETLAAFNKVEDWHPLVASSPGTPRPEFGVGASRVCTFNDGTSVHETVTAVDPGRSVSIDVSKMSMPLKEMHAQFSVSPRAGGTAVTMALEFQPKFGPMGTLMAHMMMKPMMTKMVDKVLAGLDENLTAGRIPKAA